jgi:hypothetical protein
MSQEIALENQEIHDYDSVKYSKHYEQLIKLKRLSLQMLVPAANPADQVRQRRWGWIGLIYHHRRHRTEPEAEVVGLDLDLLAKSDAPTSHHYFVLKLSHIRLKPYEKSTEIK